MILILLVFLASLLVQRVFSSGAIAAYGVAAAVGGTAVGARESQLSRKAAEEAQVPIAPTPTLGTGGAQSTAQEVNAANMQAQTAGASLLSPPGQEKQTGGAGSRQIGTLPPQGKSVLGS